MKLATFKSPNIMSRIAIIITPDTMEQQQQHEFNLTISIFRINIYIKIHNEIKLK
jgi:hypothetical protein